MASKNKMPAREEWQKKQSLLQKGIIPEEYRPFVTIKNKAYTSKTAIINQTAKPINYPIQIPVKEAPKEEKLFSVQRDCPSFAVEDLVERRPILMVKNSASICTTKYNPKEERGENSINERCVDENKDEDEDIGGNEIINRKGPDHVLGEINSDNLKALGEYSKHPKSPELEECINILNNSVPQNPHLQDRIAELTEELGGNQLSEIIGSQHGEGGQVGHPTPYTHTHTNTYKRPPYVAHLEIKPEDSVSCCGGRKVQGESFLSLVNKNTERVNPLTGVYKNAYYARNTSEILNSAGVAYWGDKGGRGNTNIDTNIHTNIDTNIDTYIENNIEDNIENNIGSTIPRNNSITTDSEETDQMEKIGRGIVNANTNGMCGVKKMSYVGGDAVIKGESENSVLEKIRSMLMETQKEIENMNRSAMGEYNGVTNTNTNTNNNNNNIVPPEIPVGESEWKTPPPQKLNAEIAESTPPVFSNNMIKSEVLGSRNTQGLWDRANIENMDIIGNIGQTANSITSHLFSTQHNTHYYPNSITKPMQSIGGFSSICNAPDTDTGEQTDRLCLQQLNASHKRPATGITGRSHMDMTPSLNVLGEMHINEMLSTKRPIAKPYPHISQVANSLLKTDDYANRLLVTEGDEEHVPQPRPYNITQVNSLQIQKMQNAPHSSNTLRIYDYCL